MNWWSSFYTPRYGQLFLKDEPGGEVDFLIGQLALEPGSLVLDQCCGAGRMSLALARRGYRLLGVEQASAYVEHARSVCPPELCQFHCADALEFSAETPCDAGFNFYSSFGYCLDDQTNLKMLQGAARSLRPGAPFVLDSANIARVLAHFQPTLESWPEPGLKLQRHSQLDWERGLLRQHWVYHYPDGSNEEFHSSLRLYLPHQLAEMLSEAGLEPEQLYGDYDESPFGSDSRRALWRARRRAS